MTKNNKRRSLKELDALLLDERKKARESKDSYNLYNSLYINSRDDALESNALERGNTSLGKSNNNGILSSISDNFKNLWRSINYDMDVQDVDASLENLRQANEEKEDVEKIQSYILFVKQRDSLKKKLENTQYTNVKELEDDIKAFLNISAEISKLDSYFMGEGRTHKVIAENMFDGAKVTPGDDYNIFTERIKRGWSNKPNYGWSELWGPAGFIGGGVEYGIGLLTGAAGVLGEVVSGGYGDAKDFVKSFSAEKNFNSSATNDYIRNISKDGDELLKRLYKGARVASETNADSYLTRQYKEAERDVNTRIEDVIEAQDNLKNGRLFGIDGAYDYNQVSEEWKRGREDYQNGSFWGAFVHPFYATADIASSLDMMKYQLYSKGADIVLRKLANAIVKKAPVVGTALTVADVAQGVTAAAVSRDQETKLEAIGAIGNRVAREAMNNGGNLENILSKIKEGGEKMGIDTESMSVDLLWQLGVALDILTGDEAFETAKRDAQKGINKLINANNALGIADYAEMLPYMSYWGDVTKGVTMFGERAGNKIFNDYLAKRYKTGFTNQIYKHSDKRIIENALSNIQGPFDRMIEKASARFIKKDMPRAALFAKHAAKYAANKAKVLGFTGAQESLEEGTQTLLTNKYNRGEFDDYKKGSSFFDIAEFAQNPLLAMEAVEAYVGASFGAPGIDGEEVRKAMNMGFWSSIIQSGGMHALTNFTGPTEDNLRGFVRQMRDDKLAVRILADEQKKLQDFSHVDMFYDRFRKGADWNSLYTSLMDLHGMLQEGRKKDESDELYKERMKQVHSSYAKQQFIEDDVKLMSAVWSLYSSKEINDFLKEKGINKNDENYRQFLRDGATALMDYHKTSELVSDEAKAIESAQEEHIQIAKKLLGNSASQEEKLQLVSSKGKLVQTIDNLRKMYAKYLQDFPKRQLAEYDNWRAGIKDAKDFYKAVGKDAIKAFGIDSDILEGYLKEEDRAEVQANRIFNTNKNAVEKLLEQAYDNKNKELFAKGFKKDKSSSKEDLLLKKQKFVKNTVIRGLVRDLFRFEESVTPYLESIFDNDEDAANELIEKAYEASKGPKAEEDWVTDRIRMLHQLKKRQAINNALVWAETQEQQLEKIKKLTGLDVDPSKIKGWVDFLKERLQLLLATERSYFEGGESYDEYFGDQSLEFDDEKDFKDLAEALYVNRAIQRAQGHVANAYRSLQEAPSVLRDAVFGKQAENTELDEIVNQHRSILDRMNSRSEADSRAGVDESVDLEDMRKLSRSAAWRLIESKLKAAEKRRKIVHRQQEEDTLQRVERVLEEVLQQQEEASPVKTTGDDNVSDAEKALRELFYHEPKKKTDAEEEIRKRKKRLAEGKDSAEAEAEESQEQSEEEIKHEDVEEELAKNESVEDDSGEPAEVLDEDKTMPDDAEDVPETLQKDADANDIEQTTNSPVENVDGMDDGPINTENIEDIAGTGAESQNDDDKTLTDDEVQTPEDIEDMDSTFLEETDTGDIAYDGNILSDDTQDAVRDDLDTYNESQRRPVPIDETKGFDDAENTEDVVGEPGPNLIWQTLFYGYNQTDIPKIVINGKTITEFNGKPLRPGAELSKKLTNPEWLRGTKLYYVVTLSQEAANVKNDKDAFTVMMVIEDKDSSYATFYRTVSEHKVSISSSLIGKDGLPKKFHTNDRENLANDLLLHNMDINKLLVAISRLDATLYKQIVAVQKDLSAESATDEDQKRKSKWIYNKLLVKGYKAAINFYARELFAQNYAALHITNLKAKEKAYNIWNLMTADTVVKMSGESDAEFEARKAKYAADRDQFELLARKYYSKQGRTIFSGQQIEAEIDKLKSTRDEIIDAYLEKNGKDYIFPEEAQIGKVEPLIVSLSNGRINSQKTPGGLPIFRNVVDESLSMTEVQDQLENEDLLIGIGKGLRASKTKPDGTKVRPIVKWGFSRQDAEQEELYEDGGCSGKIYLMVPGINGKPVPVMLGEEKFNVQHRVKKDGSTEEVPINNSRKVELCIDPQSKELLGGKNVKPSAAEVLLYMILGEVNIPGLISGQLRGRDRGNITDLVALFINADPKTLLKKQPAPGDELMQILASKQLYYGTTVNKVVKKTESGKNVTTTEAEEGVMYFHIGMKTTKEVEIPDGKGETVKQNVETYLVEKYTKELILSTGTETESAEDLRQRIVQAIATQMHWNTDDFTFGESASMDASKTILGKLVEALMNQAFKDGKFNGMSLQQILDYKVSIMDCPQLSFRIGDFYEAPEGAKTLGDLKFARGSVLAWMFKTGHLKTDLGNTPFKDPFVFGHGVKKTNPQKGSNALGLQAGMPIQPVDQEVDDTEISSGQSILNNLDYKIQNRFENGHVRGGQSGWKIRFVVKNPKTGKAFTAEEYNNNKDLYIDAAKPLLEYLIEYFQYPNSKEKGYSVIKENIGGQGHYIRKSDKEEPFKFLSGGEVGESDFTIYIGSGEDVLKFIQDLKLSPVYEMLAESENRDDVQIDGKIHGRIEGKSIGFSGYTLPKGLEKLLPGGTVVYSDDVVEIESDMDQTEFLIRDKKTGKYYGYSTAKTGVVGYVNKNMKKIRFEIAYNIFGEYLNIPTTEENNSHSGENPFYDKKKEEGIVSRLSSFKGMKKSGINLPKTLEEAKEKLKKWTEFLLGPNAKTKKFADRIDVEKNDMLAFVLLSERTVEDVCKYSTKDGDIGISEEDEEGLNEWNDKLRNSQIDGVIDTWNSTSSEKISKENIKREVLKDFEKLKNGEVEAVFIYREKSSGKIKVLVDTISGDAVSDKKPIKPEELHYFSKAATGVYSKNKTKGAFEEKKAREWLSNVLGIDQANVVVWDSAKNAHIDLETYGEVNAVVNSLTGELIGKIGLSRQGGASVHYHEAWHYVNLLMLSRREREQLYKAYKDSHPFFKRKNPTNEEVEEKMAEDFRKWVLLNEDTSYKGKIKRFFQDVLDFLRIFILVPQKAEYRKQFAKIIAGDYRQSKISQENLRYFKQEWKNGAKSVSYHIPGVTEELRVAKEGVSDEEQKGFIYISNHQEYFDASQAIAKKVVQNAKITTAKDVKKQNKRDYKEIVQELNDWINNSTDLTEDDKNLLRDVMKNEDLVKRAITEAFEELGLTAKIRTLKDYRNKDKKEQEKTTEKADVEDGEFRPDNTWDRFDLAFSKKDNAAIRAKLFMKQIPVLRRVIKKDGTEGEPEEVRDRFGLIETYSFKEAWNLIVENLWQCESIDDRNKDGYKPTSLMGMIEAKRKSNVFYESLYRQLNSISGALWKDIELRSQIFSTINSNKPQVSYLRIDDPLQKKDYSDDLEDSSFDDSEIVRNGVVADIERTWSIHNDNEEEVARNLPRDWSRALTAHGLIEVNKDGKSVISKGYATRLSGILKDVKKDIQKLSDKTAGKKLDAVLDKVISFYNEMAIPLDKDSLYVLFLMSTKGEVTDSKIVDLLKDWFVNEEQTSEGDVKLNSLAKIAQSIITAANNGSTTVKYGGDNRERELDQLYSNFGKNHHIYKLAVAINTVHPSSREFSIKGPNGERIYPVSQNSFVSDRTRKLSTSGKEFAESMTNVSEYCKNSLLLDIAGSYTKPLDQETHFKLNAFVGIKDASRKKGADYFGITPMEDYIAKMIMTEKDQIILPTMADKKTWYSLSHKNLHLVHDAILVMPYKDVLAARIYEEYEKDHEMPEDYQNRWKSLAENWYHNLDPNSEIKQRIDKLATDDYVKSNKDIQILRYSENTLNIFGKYMMSEINALIDYYSEQNIDLFVNKRPQMLTENYYGLIIETPTGQKRLDMSGNGGKMRYFHEAITFTDSNDTVYNLNQRLQYLWELQRKIESGQVKNIKEDDPLYPYVGQLAISDKDKLDGFELVRQELRRIKDLHFQQDTFISEEIKTNINSILISLTKHELDRLSEPNSPYKMVKKLNGMYLPEGVPAQLIRRYAKSISKALGGEEVTIATTLGADMYLMQDALFSLIASYVANSAISTIEFEKVFSGDPAFYKRSTIEKTQRVKNKSSLPKKGKSGVVYITDNNESVYIYDGTQYKPVKDLSGYGVERISTTMQMKDGSVVKQDIIVDDVYDTFSDKIKRLGSTLSPGDELRLHYTPEELEKYKELSITDYTNVNVEDINAQSVFADHIRTNFKKQLLIDHIRAIDPEKFKKYCEKNSLDFEKSIAKIYDSSDFFNEIYNLYSEIHSKVDKELAQQVDPYDGITVSDAQVFVRPELYRKIRIGLGQWTYDDERAYRIIESDDSGEWLADEKKYEAVRKLEIFPLKMSYFQNDPQVLYKAGNQNKGRVVPMLNKMAVFPLFKFQATSDTGKKLYDRMNKSGNELDMISFKSAVKVGASQNGVKMSKDDASVEDQICSIDDLFYNDSNQSIDYRKQISKVAKDESGKQKVDESGKPVFEKIPNPNYGQLKYRHTPSAIPVLIQKLELLRMLLNTSAHKDESRSIGTQMFKLAFSNIIDDAEYGGKKGWEIKKDIIRIINDLTDIGVANIKQEFFTNGQPDQEKIKNYIRAIIENNGLGASAEEIIESGVAASIASRRVFENSVTKVVESEVVDIETTGGSAIQQSVFGFVGKGNKDVKSQTGAYKINYNNGEELSWDLENGSMEVLLSMNFFKQVMPDDIKKKAFTEQKQWLIDHDFIKGTKTDGSQSDTKPFGVGYRIPTQGLSSMFAFTVADVMPESVGDLIIVPREFTAQTGSDFDVDKLYLATFAYKDGEYITEESDGKTKKSLSNQLLENYINLITDEKNYANARASIDVLTNKLKKDFVKGVIRSENRGYIPSLYELTPSFLVDRKREFSIGKEGIAPFALNVTNLSLTQMCHLTMRYEGNVADYEFGALDLIYGKDGRRIADWLSAMVNAHVDVAKDPYIFDLNINHATYNYANFLIRAGMGMSTFTFLSQQSLKNIADEINNAGGIYGGNIDGSKPESEIYKKRKALAIRNEFSDILRRLLSLLRDYENLKTKDIPASLLQKLLSLIEYAKYMSLTDRQRAGKYKDDNVPELKYSRKSVFDENEGIKAIENGRKGDLSSLIDYYEFQLASVRCFKEIANHAQGISSLVSASQIDTKKFGNTIKEHINFRNKIDHMYEDRDVFWTINEEGFDLQFINKQGNVDKGKAQKEAMRRYFEDSYLEHKFDEATKLIKQILSQLLFSGTLLYEDIFKEIFCQINGKRLGSGIYEKELSSDKIDAMGDAIDNMMRFNALFNIGSRMLETLPEGTYDFTFGGNKKKVIEKWQELLFGSENKKPLYERLDQFKRNLSDPEKAEEYWDITDAQGKVHNDLLDILIPQSPNNRCSIGKITLAQSLIDKDSQAKRKLISSFAQLLASEVDEVRELAEDLMFYAYYSQYDQNTINSFFDLVPVPYRKQYDESLSKALMDLNSFDESVKSMAEQDVYDDEGINKIIDVICRNYWYDDQIVPRYFIKDWAKSSFQYSNVIGRMERYGSNWGFPRFIAFTGDDSVKGNKYFKIKIGKDTLLYRKIGEVKRIGKKDGKSASTLKIFVPIPKAGLHQDGTHQFEFYADYKTPSVFKDNRITSNFSHEMIRDDIDKMIESSNKSNGEYVCEVVWDDSSIPEVYDKMNRLTYEPIKESAYLETLTKVTLHAPQEYGDHKFKDPEQVGINAADVVLDITGDGKTSISYKGESDDGRAIDPKYKDKISVINVNDGTISDEQYNKIKLKLSEEGSVNRIYVKADLKSGVQVTDEDADNYLKLIGIDSQRAKYLAENSNRLQYAVRQHKINNFLYNIIKRLREDGITGVYLDCSHYYTTTAAEAVLFCKLADNDIRAHVHVSFYSRFKNPKKYLLLKKTLNHRKEDFVLLDMESVAKTVEEAANQQEKVEEKAKKIVEDVLEEAGSGLDLSAKLKRPVDKDMDKEKENQAPPMIRQAENTPQDLAKNRECTGDESNDIFD